MEFQIIDQAIENLRQMAGLQIDWENQPGNGIDGIMMLSRAEIQHRFPVEAKKEFRNHHLAALIEKKKQYGKLMVIADTIYGNLKQALQENGIAYVDGTGNTFIQDGALYVLIEGKKPQRSQKKVRHKAFTKTGLKIVFHFLLREELINQPYRQIAEYTGTSLDAISKTLASLKALGFIIQVDKGRIKLVRKKELLERWIYNYGDKLKPSLSLGRFRFLDKETNWKGLQLDFENTQWGGEPGGDLLTGYLRPEILTMYTRLSKAEMMKKNHLVPEKEGNIQVYKRFWGEMDKGSEKVVPTILIYADLIYSGNPRNLETAGRIYEQYLQNEFS